MMETFIYFVNIYNYLFAIGPGLGTSRFPELLESFCVNTQTFFPTPLRVLHA